MKRIMRLHRYLSLLIAPAMLFFAVSGAWQAFRFQETKKDGSYVAPVVLQELSHVHKAERLKGAAGDWFRFSQLAVAGLFSLTALLGIYMGFKVSKSHRLVWLCLALGIALPALLAWLARAG